MKKKSDEERLRLAAQAKAALENHGISYFIDQMRSICYYNITTSKRNQQDEREDLYYMLRTVDKFESMLNQFAEDGKILEKELEPSKIRRLMR